MEEDETESLLLSQQQKGEHPNTEDIQARESPFSTSDTQQPQTFTVQESCSQRQESGSQRQESDSSPLPTAVTQPLQDTTSITQESCSQDSETAQSEAFPPPQEDSLHQKESEEDTEGKDHGTQQSSTLQVLPQDSLLQHNEYSPLPTAVTQPLQDTTSITQESCSQESETAQSEASPPQQEDSLHQKEAEEDTEGKDRGPQQSSTPQTLPHDPPLQQHEQIVSSDATGKIESKDHGVKKEHTVVEQGSIDTGLTLQSTDHPLSAAHLSEGKLSIKVYLNQVATA